jgi:hypothetical protein
MAGDYAIDPDEAPQPGDEVEAETRASEVKRVTLTKAEVEVLTALMPLAATVPRAAKRFVNLYRLARASRSGEALRRFLGETGETAEFPAIAVLLALTCGCDAEQWQDVYRFVADEALPWVEPARVITWIDVETGLLERSAPPPRQAPRAPAGPWRRLLGAEWPDALRTLNWPAVQAFLPEAARYSFHAPGLDRSPPSPDAPPMQPGSPA